MGVGRNHRTPPATIITYSFCLVHVHTSGHTSTPVTSTAHPTFLKNLTNKVRVGLSIRNFSVMAQSLEDSGVAHQRLVKHAKPLVLRRISHGHVGLSSHRTMRVREEGVNLCLRTHLCTIIPPVYVFSLHLDWPL